MNYGTTACEEEVCRLVGVDAPRNSHRAKNGSASPLARVLHRLRCPVCQGKIRCETESCACLNPTCGRRFGVIDGVPLLLDEKSSVFQPQELQRGRNPFSSRPSGSAKLRAGRALPTIGKKHPGQGKLRTVCRTAARRFSEPLPCSSSAEQPSEPGWNPSFPCHR